MANEKMMKEMRSKSSQCLLAEAQPYLAGDPKVWARRFNPDTTTTDIMGNMLKNRFVPFAKGKYKIGVRIFHDLPLKQGLLHVVQCFSGPISMPQDFMMKFDGVRIPHAVQLEPGKKLLESWKSEYNQEKGSSDPFCDYLDGIEEEVKLLFLKTTSPIFAGAIEREPYVAYKTSVKVPWTMQLIPLKEDQVLFMWKHRIFQDMKNYPKSCELPKYLTLFEQMKDALEKYNYDGPVETMKFPTPTISFLAVPELADLIDIKGEEMAWPE